MYNDYNRYTNLDTMEWSIMNYLVNSTSKYARYLWKVLKYDTPDCLSKPELTKDEKLALIYTGDGEGTGKRVFLSPYLDDAWVEQSAHLHVYIGTIKPQDHVVSTVTIRIECIVHNKISTVNGDASEYNPDTNPVEIENGVYVTPYKSRAAVMMKCIMAELNGKEINGVGTLICDRFQKEANQQANGVEMKYWNSKSFFGYQIEMGTMISGVSQRSEFGF